MKESDDTAEREKALVEELQADFKRRQEERRTIERGWQLNLNFLSGNQYCDVNALGELEYASGGYYWQEKRVFNHIAPIIDTRCSKLTGTRPKLTVRAASDDDVDRRSAKLSSAILAAASEDCGMDGALSAATVWSEACGTVFYKIIWDSDAGNEVGKTFDGASVREGKAKIVVASPFEIYPDSLSEENLYNQRSIIHARSVPAEDIYAAYGVQVEGRDIEDYSLSRASVSIGKGSSGKASARAVKHGYEVVIERYVRPNCQFPQGRLTIAAGDKLLFDGDLPYVNGDNGGRIYPFAVQYCMPLAGSFFGECIVDRLIPVQRAYNAVKNRKHEFLNRISMGMLAVEEGSTDTDELLEDGLAPGKVLVYRQGATPPEMLTLGTVPSEFTEEEERLEREFARISGTNDITQNASVFSSVTSATGLQLIIEQDDARLNVCYEQIRSALKCIGKMLLRLYRQFAPSVRLIKYAGAGDSLSAVSFKGSDITGDDVVLEADSDANMTPARRRATLYDMIDRGLFSDKDGEISSDVKGSLLQLLGYNGYAGGKNLSKLQRQRAEEENEAMRRGDAAEVKDYDEHAVHIEEHTAFLLAHRLSPETEKRVCAHIERHKNRISEVKNGG